MFQEERTQFQFQWAHLGDIQAGRPNLGPLTNVAVYRLMQFTLRDAMIKHLGVDISTRVFYDAGCTAGKAIYENLVAPVETLDDLVAKLQQLLRDLNIGILRVEAADAQTGEFTLTVAEDLDCSGLPATNEVICTYDEGFLAGILESHYGIPFEAKEVDCWCSGDRVCRFKARPRESGRGNS